MAKLTDRQRKQIIAEYVAGGISQRELAKKYGCSLSLISKILTDKKVVQKCTDKKKENTQLMLDYLDSQRGAAEDIITKALKRSSELVGDSQSVKELMGAIKILSEVFGKSSDTDAAEGRLNTIVATIKGEAKDDEEE